MRKLERIKPFGHIKASNMRKLESVHKQVGSYMRKLEVVHKQIRGCMRKLEVAHKQVEAYMGKLEVEHKQVEGIYRLFFYCSALKMTKYRDKLKYPNCSAN